MKQKIIYFVLEKKINYFITRITNNLEKKHSILVAENIAKMGPGASNSTSSSETNGRGETTHIDNNRLAKTTPNGHKEESAICSKTRRVIFPINSRLSFIGEKLTNTIMRCGKKTTSYKKLIRAYSKLRNAMVLKQAQFYIKTNSSKNIRF
jgi:hypothetical protein